jgi:hypothetical protein
LKAIGAIGPLHGVVLRGSTLAKLVGSISMLLGACAEPLGTLVYRFAVGKNIGGAVHPLLGAFLNVR